MPLCISACPATERSYPLVPSPPLDSDGDCLPDAWEFEHTDPPSFTALDPDSDLDRDLMPAWLEFVHGFDPNSALDGPPITGLGSTFDLEQGTRLTIDVRLNPTAHAFYEIRLELSPHLLGWLSASPFILSQDQLGRTYRVDESFENHERMFFRLEATKREP